jgi:uncharacterized membrane protein
MEYMAPEQAEQDNLDIPATQRNLLYLAQKGLLDWRAYERALKIIGFTPDADKWNRFLNILLLILGSGFSVCGIYFFFAYNWADMHRFVKLGIIEFFIVGLIISATALSLEKLTGKIVLTVAGVLIGALLAVYGQIYQTGADSYTLFFFWALLMAGWVFISRFTPMWFIWILLIHTSLLLYWDQMVGYGAESQLLLWILIINGIFVLGWEIFSRKTGWLISRWMPRILSLGVYYCLTYSAAVVVGTAYQYWGPDTPLIVMAFLFVIINAVVLYVYSQRYLDIFMLTISAISLMVVFDLWLANLIGEANDFLPLILGVLIIAQTALVVRLLLKTSKSWEARR